MMYVLVKVKNHAGVYHLFNLINVPGASCHLSQVPHL